MLARLKLEVKLGRYLTNNEEVDHIDGDCTNDSIKNLQVLTKSKNAAKSALGNKHCAGFKQSEKQKRNGAKNGMSKLTTKQVEEFRNKYESGKITVRSIEIQSGLSNRSVRNFLQGISYTNAGGPLANAKSIGRPKK